MVRALASHQCVPGSIPGPGVICGLSLLLVLALAPRVFLRFSGFPPSSKINISKFQFDREFEGHGFVSQRLLCATLVKTKSILATCNCKASLSAIKANWSVLQLNQKAKLRLGHLSQSPCMRFNTYYSLSCNFYSKSGLEQAKEKIWF